jgi:hypothetical protein
LKRIFLDLDNGTCNVCLLKAMDDNIYKQFLDILTIFVELYHFFKYKQNKDKKSAPYNVNYWRNVKDIELYMKKNIVNCAEELLKIKVKILYQF